MSDDEKKPKIGVQGWRAPALPGLTGPIPPGGKGLAIGPRHAKKLLKIVRTYDNVKTVKALAPYARSAEECRDALIAELTATYGLDVGPSVCLLLETTGLYTLWSRFFTDDAAKKLESGHADAHRVVQLSMLAADGAKANLLAAHDLQRKIASKEKPTVDANTLDQFGSPPEVFPVPSPDAPEEP